MAIWRLDPLDHALERTEVSRIIGIMKDCCNPTAEIRLGGAVDARAILTDSDFNPTVREEHVNKPYDFGHVVIRNEHPLDSALVVAHFAIPFVYLGATIPRYLASCQ